MSSRSKKIFCPSCRQESAVKVVKKYDGFTLVGEIDTCAFCGYEFNEDLSNLAEGSAFHFRAQFRNSLGIFNGNDQAFSTLTPLGPVVLIEDELAYLLEAT